MIYDHMRRKVSFNTFTRQAHIMVLMPFGKISNGFGESSFAPQASLLLSFFHRTGSVLCGGFFLQQKRDGDTSPEE